MSDFQRFFILENVGKIKKTLKNVKKTFFTSMVKSVSDMTYLVSSGTFNLNSVNQSSMGLLRELKRTQQKRAFVETTLNVERSSISK